MMKFIQNIWFFGFLLGWYFMEFVDFNLKIRNKPSIFHHFFFVAFFYIFQFTFNLIMDLLHLSLTSFASLINKGSETLIERRKRLGSCRCELIVVVIRRFLIKNEWELRVVLRNSLDLACEFWLKRWN